MVGSGGVQVGCCAEIRRCPDADGSRPVTFPGRAGAISRTRGGGPVAGGGGAVCGAAASARRAAGPGRCRWPDAMLYCCARGSCACVALAAPARPPGDTTRGAVRCGSEPPTAGGRGPVPDPVRVCANSPFPLDIDACPRSVDALSVHPAAAVGLPAAGCCDTDGVRPSRNCRVTRSRRRPATQLAPKGRRIAAGLNMCARARTD